MGAAGHGAVSAAARQDYAAAAAIALLQDEQGNRTYELGGPAFDLTELARVVSETTDVPVAYHDLSVAEYVSALQRTGLDETTAQFVAALDASIAHGDLETTAQDLPQLLGRPATPLADVVRTALDSAGEATARSGATTIGLIGAGNIGGTVAALAVDAGYNVVLPP